MDYTQEQLAGFKQEYARRRQQETVVTGLVVIAFGVLVLFRYTKASQGPVFVAWAIGAVVVVVFTLKNMRCPACGRLLGRGSNLNFCPRCGVALQ